MTKKAKKFRCVMCGVVSFLLSVSLTLALMLGAVRVTALNPEYAVKIAEKSGFSEKMLTELKEEFISYGNACNVDESFFDSVFNDIITPEQINADFATVLKDFYADEIKEAVDTSTIETKLLASLETYANSKGFESSKALTESLTDMCTEMGELYNTYISMFSSSYFETAANILTRAIPYATYAVIGLFAFSLAAMIVIRLSFKKRKNYTRYYIYAFSGATLMLAVAPALALVMKIGSKINIANASLYGFASAFINNIFIAMLLSAAIMAVVTAVTVLIRNGAVTVR